VYNLVSITPLSLERPEPKDTACYASQLLRFTQYPVFGRETGSGWVPLVEANLTCEFRQKLQISGYFLIRKRCKLA
jgi:hypothetical protein